jgi:hypothetical protein
MRCEKCGIPKGIGKANIWRNNGIIVSKYEPDLRGALYDVDELNYLFESFSRLIGFDISRLVIEGKRKDSAYYTGKLLRHMADSGAQTIRPDDFFRIMASNYSIPGFGKIEVLDYREGEGITLEVENIYSVPMAKGQAAGVFEAVLKRRADVHLEGNADKGRIILQVVEGEPELEQRMQSEVDQAAPTVDIGDREYELCPECNAPLELSREYDWDVDEARILDRHTGKRFIFDNVRGLDAVVRVLIEELGEAVESLITDISRDYAREYYRSLEGSKGIEEELALFSLRGWGLPAGPDTSDDGFDLRIYNPFYPPIMTGKAWGLLEALGGKELQRGEASGEGGVLSLGFKAA